MKKSNKKTVFRALVLLTICAVLTATGSLAAEAGSAQDPLVTLSYLNNTFLPSVLARVDEKIAGGGQSLGGGFSGVSSSSFAVVTLSGGQTLRGGIGCEVMLRVGTAACVSASSPGLIDETSGSVLENGGALIQNHLYMMTIEDRGVQAGEGTTKLLVRGSYTVG